MMNEWPYKTQDLSRWALLSIAAAALTIALKTTAWLVTGSVGLLSDAAESVVNLVAAVVAFVALKVAARPPTRTTTSVTRRASTSAIIEGTCIAIAAVVIIISAVERLLNPKDIESAGIGLLVSVIASMINGAVALALIRAGRRHRSVTLEADGKHLATDVDHRWNPDRHRAGGDHRLEHSRPDRGDRRGRQHPVRRRGLVGRAAAGLMDTALPDEQRTAIDTVLGEFSTPDVMFHDVRTRSRATSGSFRCTCLCPATGRCSGPTTWPSGSSHIWKPPSTTCSRRSTSSRSATPRLRGLAVEETI